MPFSASSLRKNTCACAGPRHWPPALHHGDRRHTVSWRTTRTQSNAGGSESARRRDGLPPPVLRDLGGCLACLLVRDLRTGQHDLSYRRESRQVVCQYIGNASCIALARQKDQRRQKNPKKSKRVTKSPRLVAFAHPSRGFRHTQLLGPSRNPATEALSRTSITPVTHHFLG